MPRLTKRRKAAVLRERTKKVIRSAVNPLSWTFENPWNSGFTSPSTDAELHRKISSGEESVGESSDFTNDVSIPCPNDTGFENPGHTSKSDEEHELRDEIDIKTEPLEDERDEQLLQQDEMEVEVELLKRQDANPSEEERDPFGQDVNQKTCQETIDNQQNIRCQFCLKLIREIGGQNVITRAKVDFVLGLRKWGTPRMRPNCCEGCRKMFDLFYEFKRSCLMALARPAELLVWEGAKKSIPKVFDLKPKARNRVAVSVGKRPVKGKTKNVQGTEALDDSKADCKQEGFEIQTPSTEAISITVTPDVMIPGFECEICLEKFSDELLLKNHWKIHFPTSSGITTQPAAPEELTDRPVPEAPASNPASETDPPIAETNDDEQMKTFCSRCRKWFSTKTIFMHHKPYCIKVSKNQPFQCNMCPQKFQRQPALTLHINKHNGVRTIPCRREGCTKMFFTVKTRHTHERICGQVVKLICSICGMLFRSEGGMRIHMSTHGDPKYPCDICDKVFYRKANKKKHAATHSEERKFQCNVCGKRFKSHEANRVHQRIHTQEKPYPCHICGQRFMYNCLLKTHLEKGHEPEEAM